MAAEASVVDHPGCLVSVAGSLEGGMDREPSGGFLYRLNCELASETQAL